MTTHDEIVQGLIDAFKDDNHMVRSAAVRAMGRTKDAAVVPLLLLALRDKAGFVSEFAVTALSKMDDEAIPPAMLERLTDKDEEVRRAAAIVLGARQDRAAVPALIAALDDEVLAVAHAAAQSLGEIGDPVAVQPLIERLQDPGTDWIMCINASVALGALGDSSAAPAMIELFRRRWEPVPGMNTVPPVRKNVLEALVKLGDGAVPYLLEALKDPDVKVRHGAVEVLGHIAGGELAGDSSRALKHALVAHVGECHYTRFHQAGNGGYSGMRKVIPLSKRPGDIPILIFFIINLTFITYIVDIEQLVIADPANFTYPAWPPPVFVDLIHNYGYTFDPLLIARPPWWKMTIWIDVLYFGPFYAAGIYAFIKGKEWIRIPAFVYCGMLLSNVIIILGEEIAGPHATPQLPVVLALNAPWLLMPFYIIYRLGRTAHPFTEALSEVAAGTKEGARIYTGAPPVESADPANRAGTD